MKKKTVKKLKRIKRMFFYAVKGCPLAMLLVFSTIVLTVFGLVSSIASGNGIHISADRPLLAAVFTKDEADNAIEADYFVDAEDSSQDDIPDETSKEEASTKSADKNRDGKTNNGDNNKNPEKETGYPTKFEDTKKVKTNSPYYSDPGKVALTTSYPFEKVDKKYFDDALFIGDSRIEGLKMYSGLDNATFYSKEGMTIYGIMSEKFIPMKIEGKKKNVTVPRALKDKKFKKIYMMLGINELGSKNTEEFAKEYKNVVEELKKLQPEAKVIIMGIMKVTDDYSKKQKIINNVNINDKNVAIAKIANGIDVFYLDFNKEVEDSKNALKKSYSWDGVHLKAEYYSKWVDFLEKHGIK